MNTAQLIKEARIALNRAFFGMTEDEYVAYGGDAEKARSLLTILERTAYKFSDDKFSDDNDNDN